MTVFLSRRFNEVRSSHLQLALHAPYKAFIFNLRLVPCFLIKLPRRAVPAVPVLGLGVFPLAATSLFTSSFQPLS